MVDISAITHCTLLTTLDLSECRNLADISALAMCTSLTLLDLHGCIALVDVAALAVCTALTGLNLVSCHDSMLTQMDTLQIFLPECTLVLEQRRLVGVGNSRPTNLPDVNAVTSLDLVLVSFANHASGFLHLNELEFDVVRLQPPQTVLGPCAVASFHFPAAHCF